MLNVFSSIDEQEKRLKNENFKKYFSDSFPQNLFLLSSERPGFNQAGFTHGEVSSPRFSQRWYWKCYSWYLQYLQLNEGGSSWLRGTAIRLFANLVRNCQVGTPSPGWEVFRRVTYLREVREVFSSPVSRASFLHWEQKWLGDYKLWETLLEALTSNFLSQPGDGYI